MTRVLALLIFVLCCGEPRAGAWTEPRGHWQIISGLIFSDANRSFDTGGDGVAPVLFKRVLPQNDAEYGLRNSVTLFVRTETAWAHFADAYTPEVSAVDNAVELGTRIRLLHGDNGVLSLETSLRTAGAFNFAVSANSLASGRAATMKLLYGRNFKLFGFNGFTDLQAGEIFLSRPRPNETAIDLTAGLWLGGRTMAMIQSFNLIGAGGGGGNSYPYFRSHKLEVSLVRKQSRRYSLQLGGFVSPMGQNALVEQGLCVSLWANL
jgi:protein XagA